MPQSLKIPGYTKKENDTSLIISMLKYNKMYNNSHNALDYYKYHEAIRINPC